jgi:AraC family ethanolamine operon transcriptional activator
MSINPTHGQAAVTVVDITDPTNHGDTSELINLDAVQLQSAPFRARRIIVHTKDASVIFHSTNHRVRTRTSICEGKIAYTLFGHHAEGTINGIPVRPGLMLAISPSVEANVVVKAEWETTTFLFPPDFVRAQFATLQRDQEFSMPDGIEMLEVNVNSAQRLFDWGKQLVEIAAEQASTFNEHQDVLSAIQCDLVENILATLGTTKCLKPSSSDRTSQRHSVVVKLAEDFAVSQRGTNLYVSDLCQAAKVSERTLEYAFKEVLGLTPVAFLTRIRLHRVRQDLLSATPRSTTVAHEALRWGFWHFGEFSHAYNNCFGELPSDTLLRTGDLAT